MLSKKICTRTLLKEARLGRRERQGGPSNLTVRHLLWMGKMLILEKHVSG